MEIDLASVIRGTDEPIIPEFDDRVDRFSVRQAAARNLSRQKTHRIAVTNCRRGGSSPSTRLGWNSTVPASKPQSARSAARS